MFTHKGHYVTHLKNVHNTNEESVDMKTVQCQKCPFKFLNNYSFELHETKIHQKKTPEKKIHDCPQCQKTFSTQIALKFNQNTLHNQEAKTFKCDFCVFESTRKYSIKRNIVQTHQQKEIKSGKILKQTQSYKKVKNIVDHLKESSLLTSKLHKKKLEEVYK